MAADVLAPDEEDIADAGQVHDRDVGSPADLDRVREAGPEDMQQRSAQSGCAESARVYVGYRHQ